MDLLLPCNQGSGDPAGKIIAPVEAGVRRQARQHGIVRQVELGLGQHLVHQLDARVEVILERPRHRFVEIDRVRNGLLILGQNGPVFLHA